MSSSDAAQPPSSDTARRKRLGEIARDRGFISADQLRDALDTQAELAKLGLSEKIGQILFKKNLVDQDQLKEILRSQGADIRKLGNFEVFERIGHGAMGVVFRARQISMDRIVALKILAPKWASDPVFIERFVREARAAGQFSHENIVNAVDVGYAEPYHYFAMEYVQGETLRQRLHRDGPLDEQEALRIARQMAAALDHALQRNIIHRDVKPDNIMLTKDGLAKLLDLGLASTVGADASAPGEPSKGNAAEAAKNEKNEKDKKITGVRKAVGTPHYISPEGARGEDDLDTRTDLYSLGCSLFHTLADKPPFAGETPREILIQHVTHKVPDIRTVNPKISAPCARILEKMTARDRDQRYAHPIEVMEDIDAALAGKRLPHAGGRTGLTTGPRAPIKGRGTTGPRRPVGARHTTGPATPVHGDRTGAMDGKVGDGARATASPAEKKGPALYIAGGVGALGVIVALAAMLGGGDPPRQRESAQAASPAAASVEPTPAAAPDKKEEAPETVAPVPPPDTGPSPRELAAQAALDHAKKLMAEKPDDFAAHMGAYERANRSCEGTDHAEAAAAGLIAAQKAWQAAFDAALEKQRAEVQTHLGKEAYAAAHALWQPQTLPANVRAGDAAVRWSEEQKKVATLAESAAVKWLAEARAKAGEDARIEDLDAALAIVQKAVDLGAKMAPTAREANAQRKEWNARKNELLKVAAARQAQEAALGEELLAATWKELWPLLKQNRFGPADELLESRVFDPNYAPAKEGLKLDRADLAAMLALRQKAVEALRAMDGKKIELIKGGGKLAGTIQKDQRDGVSLKLDEGPELTISAAQLDAVDVDRFAPKAGDGEGLRLRALVFLAAGDMAKAKSLLELAKNEKVDVARYLHRIQVVEVGEVEANAATDYEKLLALARAENWEALKTALADYRKQHGKTEFAKAHAKELAEMRAQVLQALSPMPVEGLGLWLRADTGVIADVKGLVRGWMDQSPHKHNAGQRAADQQPLKVRDEALKRFVLRFDGKNDWLEIPGVQGEMKTFTLTWVMKPASRKNWSQTIAAKGHWEQFVFHTTNEGGVYVGTSVPARISPGEGPNHETVQLNVWQVFTYRFDNGKAQFFKNGKKLAEKNLAVATWTGFQLGNNSDNSLHGDFGEISLYDRALSDQELGAITTWLMKRYAVPAK